MKARTPSPQTGRIYDCNRPRRRRSDEEADLAGVLLETGDWDHLNLPALAQVHESIPVGPGQVHHREPGEALHPERMSVATLERVQAELGSLIFAGQYLQQPAPGGGGIVRWNWFKYYDDAPKVQYGDRIIQSWDHAFTTSENSNFSVCMTFLCRGDKFYVLDVLRCKKEFPELMRFIPEYSRKWNSRLVVLESSGAGVALCQALRQLDYRKYWWLTPKVDKIIRLMKVSPFIENGLVFLPKQAPWLDLFRQEILNFPNGKYDDQVDALTQFLEAWPALRHKPNGIITDAEYEEEPVGSRFTLCDGMPNLSIPDLFKMRIQ